jgi:hypothetical protein
MKCSLFPGGCKGRNFLILRALGRGGIEAAAPRFSIERKFAF